MAIPEATLRPIALVAIESSVFASRPSTPATGGGVNANVSATSSRFARPQAESARASVAYVRADRSLENADDIPVLGFMGDGWTMQRRDRHRLLQPSRGTSGRFP